MSSERQSMVEELVALAGELPPPAATLRKRVMKSVRQAHRRRTVRRRIQWSLGASAAALALAATVNVIMTPGPSAHRLSSQQASPADAAGTSVHPDWDRIENAKRQRPEKAGAIHGSF